MDKSKVTAGRSRASETSLKRWFPGEGEALPPTDVPVYTNSAGTTAHDKKPPPHAVDDLIRLRKKEKKKTLRRINLDINEEEKRFSRSYHNSLISEDASAPINTGRYAETSVLTWNYFLTKAN